MLGGKIIILGALNILYVFYEGPLKMAHYKKKTLSFVMCPCLINMDCK
jgi:hypothetical protein